MVLAHPVMRAMNSSPALGVLLAVSAAFVLVLSTGHATAQNRPAVDLALVLALDVSGSVDQTEFALQRDGLVAAIKHRRVVDAITRGPEGKVSVAVVQWAGLNEQSVSVPWSIVSDHASAAHFARKLAQVSRQYSDGSTHISGVIRFATQMLTNAPVTAQRRVIDISGDGIDNVRYSPRGARDAAMRLGITINGLAILNENTTLDAYYKANVIGGPDAFVLTAESYRDYATSILLKLLREIELRFASVEPMAEGRVRIADSE